MRSFGSVRIVLLGAALCAGCQTPRQEMMRRLGPGGEVIVASLDNLGWSQAERKVRQARFTAIVTTWDEAGKSYTDRQEMEVDFRKDQIEAVGGTPQGSWKAEADGRGHFDLHAPRPVDRQVVRGRMAPTLSRLLHALRGPYNLLGPRERPRIAANIRVDGQDVVRVAVAGDNRQAVAYYFDAATGILKFVTAGADRPGRDGTVTIYQYDSHPNGVLFPSRIKVVRIGRNVLVGDLPVLEVEISGVRF